MSRPNPWVLIVFLLGIVAAMGGAAVLKGGVYIAKHEGDTLHLVDIVMRMARGELPHLDFLTPIGILAFAPIAALAGAGMGFGMAFIWAQILFALALVPAVVWVAVSRLSAPVAYLFGLFIMVLALALVHGEAQQSISLSMHYNRMAWALAFLAITLAVLPARGPRNQSVDGLVIGLCMAALALLKVTYFVVFAPPVVIAMLLRGQLRALVAAVLAGLAVVAAMTAYAGAGFWGAYLSDLMTVATSGVRTAPSGSLEDVLGAPAYVGATLLVFFSVILLRQSRERVGGLVLLLLIPGFIYVTYQNYGNDPQWLWLLAVLMLAMRPGSEVLNGLGWNMRGVINFTVVAVLTAGAPSFFNLLYSPFRNLAEDTSGFTPLLSRFENNSDLQLYRKRALRVDIALADDRPGEPFAAYRDRAEREPLASIKGEQLRYCSLDLGTVAWMETIARDLEARGFADDTRFFMADLLSGLWLYSDRIRPTPKAAPWYYGGLAGLEQSDYVLVPLCPISNPSRKKILDALDKRGTGDLTEVFRNDLYILYKKGG